MKKVLLTLLLLPSLSFCCDPYVEYLSTQVVLIENEAASSEVFVDPSIEDILRDFYYIKVERSSTGGSMNTAMIQRLAASERREEQSHGKDHFWRRVLEEREQEEEAAAFLQRLDS